MVRLLALPVLLVALSGCVPVGFTIASYAVDGVSYVGSGKSVTDHMLSDFAGRDCATWRIIKSRPICKDFTSEEIARRKKNKDEIRYDVQYAYIATNLDGIDFDKNTGLATISKPRAKIPAARPAPAKPDGKPVQLKSAPVEREDLPPADGKPSAGGKPMVKRPADPDAVRRLRTVSTRPAGDRYLVFGSFRRRSEAERFAGRHAVMQPAILPVRVRGKLYYRVVVRPDGSEALAMARHQLRQKGVKDAYTMRICRSGAALGHCMKPIATTHVRGRPALRPVSSGD